VPKSRSPRPPKRYTIEAAQAASERWLYGHDGYPLTLIDEYLVVEAVGLSTEIKYMGSRGWWTPRGYAKTLGDLRALHQYIVAQRAQRELETSGSD